VGPVAQQKVADRQLVRDGIRASYEELGAS